ncbi:MAG: transposase [Tannerella sp.]|jgi:transposase|nr:transposase [Tannerella sp.]
MELIQTQYDQISDCFPKHRGNLTYTDLQVLNAFLYIAENGCRWRPLPEKYGNRHTVYCRINRRAKGGVLDRAFAKLQEKQIARINIEVISMDSTGVKVHPDAAGALKKTEVSPSECPAEDAIPKFIRLPRVIG